VGLRFRVAAVFLLQGQAITAVRRLSIGGNRGKLEWDLDVQLGLEALSEY